MLTLVKNVVFVALFMGFVLVYAPLRLVLPPGSRPHLPVGLVGLAPLAVGLVITLWCVSEFATRGNGTPAVFDPPKRLVTRGLYTYVRNPMYLGASLMLAGMSILYASLDVAIYAAAFIVIAHVFVVLYEEWALTQKFGDAYRAYRSAVPRWIPRVGRARAAA